MKEKLNRYVKGQGRALQRFLSTPLAGRAFAILVLVGGITAALLHRQVTETRAMVLAHVAEDEQRVRRLAATAGFDSVRQALVDRISEEVSLAEPDEDEASERARIVTELIVRASEKYPMVDPVLLASVGIVDERFYGSSGGDALHHPHPDAARRVAEELGWNYDDDTLEDPAKSAEIAARHLGELHRAYNDVEMVLAEYNGGPLNAGYMRAQVDRLSARTRSYVPEVLELYHRLAADLDGKHQDGRDEFIDAKRRARTLADAAWK